MTAGIEDREVVILGAGPGGLAAAACLGRRGVSYLLLEKGEAPCAALRKIHPGMTLVSPRPLSWLPHMESLAGRPAYMDLHTYLEVLDRVELTDGEVLEPDLMVFATGYSYATPHLGDLFRWPAGERPRVRNCESLDTPGLFLLGIHFARTFASPYLRGIGRDAAYVARRIARRLEAGPDR